MHCSKPAPAGHESEAAMMLVQLRKPSPSNFGKKPLKILVKISDPYFKSRDLKFNFLYLNLELKFNT
jgi:hypothetical protein